MSDLISASHARILTDRIKVALEATWDLVAEAYRCRAWTALGYDSWDDYCTREFGTSRIRLPREERQEVIASLRDAGLSTRAIGAALGIDHSQVVRNAPPATPLRPNLLTAVDVTAELDGDGPDDDPPPAAPVIGLDGKRYPTERPKPARIITPEQQAAIDEQQQIERCAVRIQEFLNGWRQFQRLGTDPRRERIIACLTDRDRELLAEAERTIRWAA